MQTTKPNFDKTTNFDFVYFLSKIAEIEAGKRDSIPEKTIKIWFNEVRRRNWSKETLDERCIAVLSKKIYGSVQFNDFIEAEECYTRAEVKDEARRMIAYRIQEAKNYPENVELSENQKINLALRASDEVVYEQRMRRNQLLNEYFEQKKEELRMKLKEKREVLNGLSLEQRAKLSSMLEREGIIQPGIESTFLIHHTADFVDKIPDEILEQITKVSK